MKNSRLLLIVLTVAMTSLVITGVLPAYTPRTSAVPVPGTTVNFTEDFSTPTYLDFGNTTAFGWGLEALSSERLIFSTSLDSYTSVGSVYGLDVQGRKVYFVSYGSATRSNEILDITDPSNLRLLSARNSYSNMLTCSVEGDMVYAGRTNGVSRYNISDPFNYAGSGVLMGTTPLDGWVTDLDVQGRFVYCAVYGSAASDGFRIIDMTDPQTPFLLPAFWTSSTTQGIEVEGRIAYLAESQWGLYLANISNPYSLSILDSVNTPGNATDVLVDGHIAYVADGPSGIQVVDVSDPTNLNIIGSADTPGNARRLALQGNVLFVADEAGDVRVFDVANPSRPVYIGFYGITGAYALDVDLYGGVLVVGTSTGVRTFEIGDLTPTLPIIGTYSGGYEYHDVRVQGDVAYVAAGVDGLLSIDVSDPVTPVVLDSHVVTSNRFYRRLDVQGDIAVVADYGSGGGIRIYDISDPSNLQYLATWSLTWATDVAIASDIIYVADGEAGVYIANISTPASPLYLDSMDLGTSNVTAVWTQGYHLYAVSNATADDAFTIFDIRDPSNIYITYTSSMTAYHTDIYVDGDATYMTEQTNTIFWNVTNPYAAFWPDVINSAPGNPIGVWGFGPYMIVANYTEGVDIINATDPSAIHRIRTNAGVPQAKGCTVDGDYAYIANTDSLVILHLFENTLSRFSTADSVAQSVPVDSTSDLIFEATITQEAYSPPGTILSWELSANHGADWESVTPGVPHTFLHLGDALLFRVTFSTLHPFRSAYVYNITISYSYTAPPTAPTLNDPGAIHNLPAITVNWTAATDSDGTVAEYELQMSDSATFSTILNTWTPTTTSQTVSGLINGDYYFRVRAIDDDGVPGPWSNTEDLTITLTTPPLPPIPGFPIEAIAMGAIIALSLGIIYRRRKYAK